MSGLETSDKMIISACVGLINVAVCGAVFHVNDSNYLSNLQSNITNLSNKHTINTGLVLLAVAVVVVLTYRQLDSDKYSDDSELLTNLKTYYSNRTNLLVNLLPVALAVVLNWGMEKKEMDIMTDQGLPADESLLIRSRSLVQF